MVEVVFMGTGGAFSAGRRGNVALLLERGDFRMLVEAGPLVMQQLAAAGLRPADIDHVFITHSHGDHTLGAPMFGLNRAEVPRTVHFYAGGNTVDTVKLLCIASYHGLGFHNCDVEWHVLSERGQDRIAALPGVTPSITLTTNVVPHPPGIPTLAARWDFAEGPSITFVTDTFPNEAAIDLARGSDLLIHEASYSATLQPDADAAAAFHSTARDAGVVARRAGCRRLALVHLGPEIGEQPEALASEARASSDLDVLVPEDGERIRVD